MWLLGKKVILTNELIMKRHKITLKIVRSFSIGFTIFSPKLNGLAFELCVGCFILHIGNRGDGLITFQNYWNG